MHFADMICYSAFRVCVIENDICFNEEIRHEINFHGAVLMCYGNHDKYIISNPGHKQVRLTFYTPVLFV